MAGRNVEDTRVRLSAEGVEEVAQAFRRIQAEAERSATGAGRAFKQIKNVFSDLGSLIGHISFAAIVAESVLLTKHALESADAMGKLSQKTGATVETLSVLSFAAKTADIEQEGLNKALIRGVRFLDEYDKGSRAAREAVLGLFGSEKALQGLDTDQRLRKIFDALAKLEPGAKRTGTAMAIFGRSGAELLPLLDDLGEKGFAAVEAKARKLGLVIDKDLALAARRAKDSLTDLKSTAEGLATRFVAGLVPGLASAAEAIGEEVAGKGKDAFQELGTFIANLISAIIAGFLLVGKTIGFMIGEAQIQIENLISDVKLGFALLASLATKNPAIFAAALAERATLDSHESFLDRVKAFGTDIKKAIEDAFKLPTGGEAKRKRDTSVSEDLEDAKKSEKRAEAIADARLKAEESRLQNELALARAQGKVMQQEDQRRFQEGLTGLEDYFARRRAALIAEGAAEIAILQQQAAAVRQRIAAEQSRPLAPGEEPIDREAKLIQLRSELAKFENQAALQQLDAATKLAELNAQQTAAVRQLLHEQLAAEAQLLAAQGQRFEAQRAHLLEQTQAIKRLAGESEGAFLDRVRIVLESGLSNIGFEEIEAKAAQALRDLDLEKQAIEARVREGVLFQFEGEQQIRELEKERLPLLQQIADEMLAAAEAIGTPEAIQKAREFAGAVRDIGISSNKAAQDMANLKASIESSLTSDLTNFLTDGITQAKSFGDAMRGLALSVVDSLRRIAAQMLATYLISKLLGGVFGALGGGGGGSAGVSAGIPGTGGFNPGFAGGGLIRGPGSATSDSIAARLSNFEFVVRAAVVKQPGMLQFLQQVNRSGMEVVARSAFRPPSFADGGLVEAPAAAGIGRADLTLQLDDGLLLKRLHANPEFDRVIVSVLHRSRRSAQGALGI
jgi:hypothetical protein